MIFHNPLYLILLFVVSFTFYFRFSKSKKYEGTILFPTKSLFSKNILSRAKLKLRILRIFEILILVLIVIAIARPQKIEELSQSKIDVIDILMVLDISSSMLADDFPPNRLEAVKNTAKEFIKSREGDRIGVVVFAGQSFIQCPLTTDVEVLLNLIDEIEVASKDFDGTAIGMAIANATNRLRESLSESKIMILLSDGSNNSGEIDPPTAAKLANEFEIKIYTIAAGTDNSISRIPGRGMIRNEIDINTLKDISNETGGQFFRATDKEALSQIYARIDELERSEIEVKNFTDHEELFRWFLVPALFLSLIYFVLRRYIFKVII